MTSNQYERVVLTVAAGQTRKPVAGANHPRAPRPARVHVLALAIMLAAFATLVLALNHSHADDPGGSPPPNAPPQIVDFGGIQGPTQWTFEGQVIDENPVGMVVTFGGLLQGHQTTVQDSDGFFEYSVSVQGPGSITAHTIDDEQQGSNYADTSIP